MDQALKKTLLIITLFAIAMGLLESAVVIYLREILYPAGFDFPLSPIRPDLVWTEILRELATLVMLLGVGILTGKSLAERFAWFLYAFAVWDIFYYVFLWALIGWPESLMTWDVLFLLPVTWTGPVITPLIVSASMILFALLIIVAGQSGSRESTARISRFSWILLICGSLILITAFTWDYSGFILEKLSFKDIWTLPKSQVHIMVHQYIPRRFNWPLFGLGEGLILSGIFVYWRNFRLSARA
ncbi:hypothetical protein ACFLTU_03490 [Bacteroidota bacterium]